MSSLLVFNRILRLDIQSIMLVFSTPLVKYCPCNLLSGSPPPPPRVNKSIYVFIQYVTGGGGIGLCGEYIQELQTVNLTRYRTYKIALPSQTKIQAERGPQADKHLPPSPFTGQFLRKADISIQSLLVISSMPLSLCSPVLLFPALKNNR